MKNRNKNIFSNEIFTLVCTGMFLRGKVLSADFDTSHYYFSVKEVDEISLSELFPFFVYEKKITHRIDFIV